MTAIHYYFVDDRGSMRDLTTSTGPSPAEAAEIGWRAATQTEIENYVAGWPINTTSRLFSDGFPKGVQL